MKKLHRQGNHKRERHLQNQINQQLLDESAGDRENRFDPRGKTEALPEARSLLAWAAANGRARTAPAP